MARGLVDNTLLETMMTTDTTEAKRDELRQRIEAAEARNRDKSIGEYAGEAREGASEFVRDHPLASVAGGIAIGLLLGALVPGRRIGHRASSWAANLAEMGAVYGAGLFHSAEDTAEDLGDSLSKKSRSLRRSANYYGGTTADEANFLRRRSGRKVTRTMRDLRARFD